MNLRDLTYVLAVERYGSITKAAEACEVTQPTLSAQIGKLERELGIRVFERDGRGLKITAAGRTLLDHAQRIAAAVDELVAATESHRDPLSGTLRLGLIPTLAPYLLPALLPALREELPRISVVVVEDQTAPLIEALRSGAIDAAMLATTTDDERLVAESLFDEPLWVALPSEHELAAEPAIAAGAIDVATLLLLAEGHCLRDQALALCNEPGLSRKAPGDFRAASLETILNLVDEGLGMTLVPHLSLKNARLRRKLALRPFSDERAYRRISLVRRRSSPRTALLERVADLTRRLWARTRKELEDGG